MNTKKKYDLIFSIGEACSCTSALRHCFLQIASYPFDWLFGSTFIGRCNILANKFENFIEKQDLEYSYSERSISCTAYYNKKNELIFNHDFLNNVPFDEMYITVAEKYKRRIERLNNSILNSSKILIVYIEMPTIKHEEITDSEIIEGYNAIKRAYPEKDIDLLYFSNKKDTKIEKEITNNIKKIICDYKRNNSKVDYDVNKTKIHKYLRDYTINLPFTYYLRYYFYRAITSLIPNRETRHSLRKKYHV